MKSKVLHHAQRVWNELIKEAHSVVTEGISKFMKNQQTVKGHAWRCSSNARLEGRVSPSRWKAVSKPVLCSSSFSRAGAVRATVRAIGKNECAHAAICVRRIPAAQGSDRFAVLSG